MKTQILERLNDLKTKSGKSFEAVHDALGYATSTVHRWHRGESDPDMEQLTMLVEFYGGSMEELFAAVGKQEMTATANIGYQGADVMVEHYEARLHAAEEKYQLLQAHHEQRIREISDSHERSIAYLKDEIIRLRRERDEAKESTHRANQAASEITGKKSRVFWVLSGTILLLSIALILTLIIALKTGPII